MRSPWGARGQPGPVDYARVAMMDGSLVSGVATLSDDGQSFACPQLARTELVIRKVDENRISITAESLTGESLVVVARPVRREDFLLINRGFHWINEIPFNR